MRSDSDSAATGHSTRRHSSRAVAIEIVRYALVLALVVLTNAEAGALEDLDTCIDELKGPPTSSRNRFPAQISVFSWNAMKFNRSGSGAYLQDESADSDLIFLQESWEDGEAGSTGKRRRLFAPGYVSDGRASGVELRSHFSPDVVCKLQFMEPILRTPKAVLIARYTFDQAALLVINLHAINFALGIGAYERQLDAISQAIHAHRGPVIVGGDFNQWNRWRVAALTAFADTNGLREVEFDPDERSTHFGSHVDSFFLRGFTPKKSWALPTRASDHHPILAVLKRFAVSPRPHQDHQVEGSLAEGE
ncbi:MAG: endonuclease/exonuclease/phosphatase family protein [Pseudomonadota bacterium]